MPYFQWAPYVPVAERRRQASAEMAKLSKKGHPVSPVVIEGRAIATSPWGKAWCTHLEGYADFENRLPRGRTYVRNGSVVDLQIAPGSIQARVSGSSLYRTTITVKPLPKPRWSAMCKDCAGGIDSLVELLQGRIDAGVMARLCHRENGLFPSPREIEFDCSCPDGAYMCKHVAAVLYGIGARLDSRPELLFTLRQVEAAELLSQAGGELITTQSDRALAGEDLGALFGVELETTPANAPAPSAAVPPTPRGRKKTTKTTRPSVESNPTPRSRERNDQRKKPTQDPADYLLSILHRCGSMNSTQAQAETGWTASTLRTLFQRLLRDGRITATGNTRGMIYHASHPLRPETFAKQLAAEPISVSPSTNTMKPKSNR